MSKAELLITSVAQDGPFVRYPEWRDEIDVGLVAHSRDFLPMKRRQVGEDIKVTVELTLTSSGNTTKYMQVYITSILLQKIMEIEKIEL